MVPPTQTLMEFVQQHSMSAATRTARNRVAKQLTNFLQVSGLLDGSDVDFVSLSLEQVLFFLFSRVRQGLAASTVRRDAGLIDALRASVGAPRFSHQPQMKDFLRAVAHARPVGARYAGTMGYSPLSLVPHLRPLDGTLLPLRERCLFALRTVTLMRGGSAWSISRKSVQAVVDQIGRQIVVFNYDSKGSNSLHLTHDTNYVEHLHDDIRRCDVSLCPAHLLLRLRDEAEVLARFRHDRLFTKECGDELAVATVRGIITQLLRRANVAQVFTSHSLRMASSVTLKLLGVPDEDVCTRAGWHTSTGSTTRSRHYLHGRGVKDNFAKLLLLPGKDST